MCRGFCSICGIISIQKRGKKAPLLLWLQISLFSLFSQFGLGPLVVSTQNYPAFIMKGVKREGVLMTTYQSENSCAAAPFSGTPLYNRISINIEHLEMHQQHTKNAFIHSFPLTYWSMFMSKFPCFSSPWNLMNMCLGFLWGEDWKKHSKYVSSVKSTHQMHSCQLSSSDFKRKNQRNFVKNMTIINVVYRISHAYYWGNSGDYSQTKMDPYHATAILESFIDPVVPFLFIDPFCAFITIIYMCTRVVHTL